MKREKAYRGISTRLAIHYLEGLGGEQIRENTVETENWRATLSTETVDIGPTMSITEITVVFEGSEEVLDSLIERFSQKAMRAGG
jgi:hypothetical protein